MPITSTSVSQFGQSSFWPTLGLLRVIFSSQSGQYALGIALPPFVPGVIVAQAVALRRFKDSRLVCKRRGKRISKMSQRVLTCVILAMARG